MSIAGSAFAHVVAGAVIVDTFADREVVLAGTFDLEVALAGTFDLEVVPADIAADTSGLKVDLFGGIVVRIVQDTAIYLCRSSHHLDDGGGEGSSWAAIWVCRGKD